MVIDNEDKWIEVSIKSEPIPIKPIELLHVGYLYAQPMSIKCPACEKESLSVVRLEAVTCVQRFLNLINWCKNWQLCTDINHYCSNCGCYIGRYVPIDCAERCISLSARKLAAHDLMLLKQQQQQQDCVKRMQRVHQRIHVTRAQKRAERQAKRTQEQQQTVVHAEVFDKSIA